MSHSTVFCTSFRRALLAWCWSVVVIVVPVSAQETEEPAVTPEVIQQLQDRVQRLELELQKQQARQVGLAAPAEGKDLLLLLESPYLGQVYTGGPAPRQVFAARLLAVNLSGQPITLKREDVTVTINGKNFELSEVPREARYYGIQVGRQHMQLDSVSSFKEMRVVPGAAGNGWIFVNDLPAPGTVPKMVLTVQRGDQKTVVDINTIQRSLLGLEVSFIGPRKCLALLTVSGELNAINLGTIVEELDRLSVKKISRAVLAFHDGATPLESSLESWLRRTANNWGRSNEGDNGDGFPTLPNRLTEFHVANLPKTADTEDWWVLNYDSAGPTRVHENEIAAITAALKTAYQALPLDEILPAIEQGHPGSRAAALVWGAGRLPVDKLPLILQYTADNDVTIQTAALSALRHFGEPAALDKLAEFVRRNISPQSDVAISSLAASRFPPAQELLLEVLQNEPPVSKQRIAPLLARYPRPIWSATLYSFATSDNPDLCAAALRALQKVGHPKLFELLVQTLNSSNSSLRQLAFDILVARPDAESEQAALTYLLQRLKDHPPEGSQVQFLLKVKDQRSVPLLLGLLNRVEDKSMILQLIAGIADQRIEPDLLVLYDRLNGANQAQVLRLLRQWNSPKFLELAQQALLQKEDQLVHAASEGLVQIGTPAAVQMLAEALDKNPEPQTWSYLCNALGMLGTPVARNALMKARDTGDRNKRQQAINALAMIRSRSPGFHFVSRARAFVQQKQWQPALEELTKAIAADPELPEAYLERGLCLMRLNKVAESAQDYARAYQLDEYNSQALTGVCITEAMIGDVQAAVKKLEAQRERFQEDPLFLYNSACMYGRALERLAKLPAAEQNSEQTEHYRTAALRDLQSSLRRGFRDVEWMKEDPDLKSLHGDSGFQKIVETDPDSIPPIDVELN